MERTGSHASGRQPRRRSRPAAPALIEARAAAIERAKALVVARVRLKARAKAWDVLVEEVVKKVLSRLDEKANRSELDPKTGKRLHTQADLEKGLIHLRKIAPKLSKDIFDHHITIDVETGEYAIDPSALGAVKVFRERFGPDRHTFTYHIGTML